MTPGDLAENALYGRRTVVPVICHSVCTERREVLESLTSPPHFVCVFIEVMFGLVPTMPVSGIRL